MANQYRSVLASGGASTGGDALPAEVLAGKTFTNDNGAQTGTMTNNGAVSQTLAAGQSYTIPEGYHNGNGTVTANPSTGYDIVELIQCRVSEGGTYVDKTITAQVNDYLALTNSDSNATLSNTNISETSEITITGAVKIYKVNTAMSSSSTRVLALGGSGGAILHIRVAS